MAIQSKTRQVTSIFKLTFIALLVSFLTACSGIPVNQDYTDRSALINFQTYQWLPANMQMANNSQEVKSKEPFIAQRIEKAIINNLHKRGAFIDRDQPQAYISYHYSVNKTQVVTPTTSIGFGWYGRNIGLGTRVPLGYDTDTYYDVKWEVGIYNLNGQLIWRGETERPQQIFDNPEQAKTYTQEVIDAIMNQYPPK